ncbi:MAG: hypothetical protein Q4B50_07010 [Bacillota bacterium]|nr:hypothetical protein [Bacillota bacterium]
MEKGLLPDTQMKQQRKGPGTYLLLCAALLLGILLIPQAAKGIQEWQDPELRIERLQKRAAEELRLYYQGEGNWLRCHRLLQRLDKLQEDGK